MIRYENTEWYPVPNHPHLYASEDGRILTDYFYHIDGNIRILKQSKIKYGYLVIKYNYKTHRVNRLIYRTFNDIPDNFDELDVCHNDCNPKNNSIDNLYLADHKTNMNHPITRQRMSESQSGEKHYNYGRLGKDNPKSIPVNQLDMDGNIIRTWDSASCVQRELGYKQTNIVKCCKGKYKSAYGSLWSYA